MTKARVSRLEPPFEDCVVLSVPLRRPRAYGKLTQSEVAVAESLLAGLRMRDIARRRGVSVRTIANQVASIYRKLGVSSCHELAVLVSKT
jgi:DNA-binding NarL/FixJ family response regulator